MVHDSAIRDLFKKFAKSGNAILKVSNYEEANFVYKKLYKFLTPSTGVFLSSDYINLYYVYDFEFFDTRYEECLFAIAILNKQHAFYLIDNIIMKYKSQEYKEYITFLKNMYYNIFLESFYKTNIIYFK